MEELKVKKGLSLTGEKQMIKRKGDTVYTLDTAILAVSILLSILLGVLVALAVLLVLIVLVRIIPHPAVRRSVEWFPAE